ncbi:MAG: hypothetical protein JXA90_14625, partial [Planctomycetes bacterium]|nr:hypothetical protein [Planctomycetota bacterium]
IARDAGFHVGDVGAAQLTRAEQLDAAEVDLLVLAGARSLPAGALPALQAYLAGGGDLLALGLPLFARPLSRVDGKWMAPEDFEEALHSLRPERILLDFEGGADGKGADLSGWIRHANDPRSPATRDISAGGAGRALHVVVESLTGWDTLEAPLEVPDGAAAFAPGHSITCFRARGGEATRQLALEWAERDGSRWIATVDLEREWRSYALPPQAFRPWQPPPGRGGPGDRLEPSRAVRFTVGLALTHTRVPAGRHEYWLDDLGTAASPFGSEAPPDAVLAPHLESLCPAYQFFPISEPLRIATPQGLALAAPAALETPRGAVLGIHPRTQGAGFDKRRRWRWQPIIEARSPGGDHRGTVAALVANVEPAFRGGIWCGFTPADPAFYRTEGARRLLRDILAAMRRGVFLLEGGAERYTVFEGDGVRLGARVLNAGRSPASGLSARLRVEAIAGGEELFGRSFPLEVAPGAEAKVEVTWRPARWPAGGLRVTAELTGGGRAIDRLSHELHSWRPPESPRLVEARDGGLWLDGKPWKAHGINYMPSSGVGLASWAEFERWLDRASYDPEVIERDLARVRAVGFNSVSAFIYHDSLPAGNLIDFLRRCDRHDLRVNLSLRPGTPMDFRWREMREIIESCRLPEWDVVMAYDLAWEPSHQGDAHQRSYAPLWVEWVRKHYGDLQAAEDAWGVTFPGTPETPSVPPMSRLIRDGPWRDLVADYRAFLDDLVGEKYAEARRLVRTVDTDRPVSFRMQHAGDPTLNWEAMLPYDFWGLRDAVDIWEPEAYGRIGDWERVKPGRFTADYARLCDPSKPVVWAEAGTSVWDLRRGRPDPEQLEFQARFYRDIYRMLRESGSDGVFFWWYPGGFRVGERSDFGIINPDGTDRPVTRAIREEGPRFLAAPRPPSPDVWIDVDRDRDARGLFGIYEAVAERYWEAIRSGKTPGLRWARRPGER